MSFAAFRYAMESALDRFDNGPRTVEVAPVIGDDGAAILHDVFITVDGGPREWLGSRRTLEQCAEAIRNHDRAAFYSEPLGVPWVRGARDGATHAERSAALGLPLEGRAMTKPADYSGIEARILAHMASERGSVVRPFELPATWATPTRPAAVRPSYRFAGTARFVMTGSDPFRATPDLPRRFLVISNPG